MKRKYILMGVLIVLRLLVLALFLTFWFLPLFYCSKCDGDVDAMRELCMLLYTRVPDSRLILLDEHLQGAWLRGDLLADNNTLTFGIMLDDTQCLAAKLRDLPGVKIKWAVTRSHGSICFTGSSGRRVHAKLVTLFHAGKMVRPTSMWQMHRTLPREDYLPLQWLKLGDAQFLAPSNPAAVLKRRYRADNGIWDNEALLPKPA